MIVVDSNILAYYWINGPLTEIAERVRAKEPNWHVPMLWRSEMRSILTGYLRDGSLSAAQIADVMAVAEESLAGHEHTVSSQGVFDIVAGSILSAYDAEFVALAETLAVPLVTADTAILKAFPQRAVTMEAFAKEV